MMRSIPPCPSPPKDVPDEGPSYEIRVVTPLFGGGVEPGKNDPVTLIRGSTIPVHIMHRYNAKSAGYPTVPLGMMW